jgi:hypothetical protein
MSTAKHLVLTSALLAVSPVAAEAGTTVLFSSDFTSDDTGYFTFETFDPDVSARMLWDESQGFPAPGSLRLELDELGIGRALGPCLPFDLLSNYRIRADVLAVAGDAPRPACHLSIFTYDEPGCADEGGSIGMPQNQSGVWDPVEVVKSAANNPEAGIRFGVQMGRFTGTGPSSCNFDNLEIVEERITAAPDLGLPAKVVLVVLLAGLGALFASRIRG